MNIWSAAGILEKNKLANTQPFLLLLEIEAEGIEETIRLARNNEDVIFNGQIYQMFPFDIDAVVEDGKQIPSLSLKVSNATGIIQGYIQSYNGLADAKVKILLVHAAHLDNTTPEMEFDYVINETKYDESWITFAIGSSNDHSYRFPPQRYITNFCSYRYKDIRCGYNGALDECDGTLETCRIPKRFGGEPGLENGT